MAVSVSACIPTYEQTKFLKRTLDSVFSQTFTDYEVIVSDDSKSDKVKKFIESNYGDKKIAYHQNKPSLGSPANWDAAIKRARGTYIKILHHDDWFSGPNSLGAFVTALDTNPSVDFVFSGLTVEDAKTGKRRRHRARDEDIAALRKNPNTVFFSNFVGPPSSTMYRRSLNIHYDQHLVWAVDIAFYIDVLNHSPQFVYLPEALMTTTNNAGHQITNEFINNKIEIKEYVYLFRKVPKSWRDMRRFFHFFLNRFRHYDIRSLKDLEKCDVTQPPWLVRAALMRHRMEA